MSSLVKLSEVLRHRKGFIVIDDTVEYKRCRVQLHRRGVEVRDVVLGKVIKTKKQQVCKSGDFIVAEMDAKFGGYGFLDDSLEGAIVSSHYFLFEVVTEKMLPDYLAVINKTDILQKQIKAKGSTNYSAVRPADILTWTIPLPSLEDQKRIIAEVEVTEKEQQQLLPHLDQQLAYLTQLRQALLREAMQGRLLPQDPTDEPAAALLQQLQAAKAATGKGEKQISLIKEEEDLPKLPSGWSWIHLGDIADMCLGKMLDVVKNQGELQPYMRNTNVRWGSFDLDDLKLMRFTKSEDARFSVKKGDLVICEGGEPGRAAIWYGDEPIKIQKALHRVRPDALLLSSKFLYYKILLDAQSKALNDYFTGAGIQHLTGRSLGKYLIPLPPLAEQQRIVAKLEQLLQHCAALEQRIRESAHLAGQLLQTALREALAPPAGPTPPPAADARAGQQLALGGLLE